MVQQRRLRGLDILVAHAGGALVFTSGDWLAVFALTAALRARAASASSARPERLRPRPTAAACPRSSGARRLAGAAGDGSAAAWRQLGRRGSRPASCGCALAFPAAGLDRRKRRAQRLGGESRRRSARASGPAPAAAREARSIGGVAGVARASSRQRASRLALGRVLDLVADRLDGIEACVQR